MRMRQQKGLSILPMNPVEFNLIKTDTLISDIKIGYINDSFSLENTGININKQKDIESLYKYLNKENQLFMKSIFWKLIKIILLLDTFIFWSFFKYWINLVDLLNYSSKVCYKILYFRALQLCKFWYLLW